VTQNDNDTDRSAHPFSTVISASFSATIPPNLPRKAERDGADLVGRWPGVGGWVGTASQSCLRTQPGERNAATCCTSGFAHDSIISFIDPGS
jgi:hypothetical protein